MALATSLLKSNDLVGIVLWPQSILCSDSSILTLNIYPRMNNIGASLFYVYVNYLRRVE